MIEGLPWGVWLGISGTGWGLAASCAWLVYTGRLVPRTTLDDSNHDRNEWRAESRIKDQQISEKDTQLRYMAEVGETQKSVLASLQRLASREGERA